MIRRILLGLLGALAVSGAAHAACPSPNPNILAPPFYDGCSVPAVALNTLSTSVANNTTDIYNLVHNNTFASAASVTALTGVVNTNTTNIATNSSAIGVNTTNIATNATNIGYVSGSIGRPLLSFGVVPDGTTDNATAIASAASWAITQGANGATLLVPPGNVYTSAHDAVYPALHGRTRRGSWRRKGRLSPDLRCW